MTRILSWVCYILETYQATIVSLSGSSPYSHTNGFVVDTFSSKLTSIDFNQLPSFDASVTFSGIKSIGQEQVTVSDMEAWQMKKPQPPPQPASGQQQTGGHNFVFPQPHPMFPPPSMWSTNWMPMLPSPNDSFYPPGQFTVCCLLFLFHTVG